MSQPTPAPQETQEMSQLHVITPRNIPLTPAPVVPLDQDALYQQIKARYESGDMYTRLGPRSIIALNPWKSVATNAANSMAHHTVDRVNQTATQPHVYEMATNAYTHLAATGEDQCIVLSGHSSSGKTEAARMALQHLLYLRYLIATTAS